MKAEVFGYQMSTKSSRESDRTVEELQPCKVATIVCSFRVYFYQTPALKGLSSEIHWFNNIYCSCMLSV